MQEKRKVILLGLGKVGREVIHQLESCDLALEVCVLADSSACIVGDPLNEEQINNAIHAKTQGEPLISLPNTQPLQAVVKQFQKGTIIVDTSAARDLIWSEALQTGCKLVFANKNALSASWLQASRLFHQPDIRYESTVGAGLPVINTLRTMIAGGDQVTRIEGVMSGTLGYICSQLDAGLTYSQAIQQAYDAVYTEPDPRDDLSGFDVLRKALILGRTAGWQLEQTDFKVEPLYDDHLLGNSVDDFLKNSSVLDRSISRQVEDAAAQGNVLRYLATVTPHGGEIGLKAVQRNSALGALQGAGNHFAFYSRFYNEVPLSIAGPGAGIQVTANGVLNDIIALINS